MFIDGPSPRLFALPPGVDFAEALVDGLLSRMADQPVEALARVTLFVNTRRMQRRVRDVFDAGPARLLPRIRLIADLSSDPAESDLPLPANPLRRRLELSQLVAALLEKNPDLAPKSALFDLSDSLARLMDEMQGEGVGPETVVSLDISDQSGHWARTLSFLDIVQRYFGPSDDAPDPERRQRLIVERLAAKWTMTPPADPILVAGSTGSRGATALLLDAVARLPQGAVILPGFDYHMPGPVWDRLDDALTGEDHPQFRFRSLMDRLDLTQADVRPWTDVEPPSVARNRLISLSLRPAPVTDQWHAEGPNLGDLVSATQGLTLLEAPSPRIEAEAIAIRLRQAVEDGVTAALITPDRTLTRQVAAALDRWEIVPDDSAGQPLALSPPGRFLRQVAALFGERLTAEPLLSLLKHPLCNSGQDARNQHLLRTRELERYLRREGPAFPDASTFAKWAEKTGENDPGRSSWAAWLGKHLSDRVIVEERSLTDHLAEHLSLAEALSAGPGGAGPDGLGAGELWKEAAGRSAREICTALQDHAEAGGILNARDYAALFYSVISGQEVRDRDRGHPQVLIWGTLEARVQRADLTILAGMNEGVWPEAPAPDPWLNRALRQKAGLLLPERRIGLSAHDYMQAVAGPEVWITRSVRSDDADTVPSRWINRLTNLLRGLPEQEGPKGLSDMEDRGRPWIVAALALSDAPRQDPAPRPSPMPPVKVRPKVLSVTAIGRLIRDPYSIYAEKTLGLRALDPLTRSADAPLRGTVLHKIFETYLKAGVSPDGPGAEAALLNVAAQILEQECPWPTTRHIWQAKVERFAAWFLETEIERQAKGTPFLLEKTGSASMTDPLFTLTAKADRIDVTAEGDALIYDYKTGTPPSEKEQKTFEKQLLLEAAIVDQGGFEGLETARTLTATYIGLTPQVLVPAPLEDVPTAVVWNELRVLMQRWAVHSRGYTARMTPKLMKYASDYDHLSRYGEWDDTTEITPEDLS